MKKQIKIEDLCPDPNNANKGTERGKYMLDKSVSELGLGRSIVADRNNVIIAGNKTLESAYENGLTDVVVVETTGKQLVVVKRTDLDLTTDPKAKQLAIADNQVGQISLDWDLEVLAHLGGEVDLSEYFYANEIDGLVFEDDDKLSNSKQASNSSLDDEDGSQVCCPNCGYIFPKSWYTEN